MTAQQVRDELPIIPVLMPDGRTLDGIVAGRIHQFAAIHIRMAPGCWLTCEASWDTLARLITNDRPLIY